MPKHVVKPGETLLSIAQVYKFVDWQTIWTHPDNGELRGKRPDPMVLAEGDEVTIPDKEPRWERVETNKRHVFQLKALDARLKLLVEDELGRPLHGASWQLEADDRTTREGTVAARGLIDCPIPPACQKATLTVIAGKLQLTWHLDVGDLNPIDEVKGVQARLTSLGFLDGRLNGEVDEPTKKAIEAFQRRHGLPVNGDPADGQLKEALLERALV